MLFVREHNYWVAKLHAEQPSLTGNQLYEMARAITTAEYQNIIYSAYLPSLLGSAAPGAYTGYDPKANPSIMEEFSTAAFRFGHTIISPTESKSPTMARSGAGAGPHRGGRRAGEHV